MNSLFYRLLCIVCIILIGGGNAFPQIKKVLILNDTLINGVLHDNYDNVDVLISSDNKILVFGGGGDYSTDSNLKYFYTSSFTLDLANSYSFHIRKRPNVFENSAFDRASVEINKKLYSLGYLWYDSNYQFKIEGLLSKMDLLGQPISEKTWAGDLSRWLYLVTLDTLANQLLIGGNQRVNANIWSAQKFYLAKADTNLNIFWEKTYPQQAQPETHSSTAIARNRIYMCGYRYEPPWFDYGLQNHIMRKTDTAGNLMATAYLPFKYHLGYPYCNIIDDGINEPKLVVISDYGLDVDTSGGSTVDFPVRDFYMRILDTNLNIISTHIIKSPEPDSINGDYYSGGYLYNARNLGGGKLLLIGARYLDTDNQYLVSWASVVDTSGKMYWSQKYPVRGETVLSYLTDGLQLPSGGFLLSGTVAGVPNVSNQDALLIMVDSTGCLDVNGCEPLAISNISKKNANHMFVVFPNPTTGSLSIKSLKGNITKGTIVQIIDAMGKAVHQIEPASDKLESVIDINHLRNGFYFLKIVKGNELLYEQKIQVYD